jgi:membrane protease YdiL (CAAX protease family)
VWHLPTLGETKVSSLIVLAVFLPLLHLFDGMFLSFGWRRSGNLAVPAAVHALIDAVRNALLR